MAEKENPENPEINEKKQSDALREKFINSKKWLKNKNVHKVSGAIAGAVVIVYAVVFFWPRSIEFSFAGNNCFSQPLIFPALASSDSGSGFDAIPNSSISILGWPVYSNKTCIIPTVAPEAKKNHKLSIGKFFLRKTVKIKIGGYPALTNQKVLDQPISTFRPIAMKLDKVDKIFGYRLQANKQNVKCNNLEESLICNVSKLKLKQSNKYDVRLERIFENLPTETLFDGPLKTVSGVKVISSDITNNQTVYKKPEKLTLKFNKAVESTASAKLYRISGKNKVDIPVEKYINKKTFTVKFSKALARNTKFVFETRGVTAKDGGYLEKPYQLKFRTSGGPKVLGVSIGTYKAPTSGSFYINFDSPLSTNQSLDKYFQLTVGGRAISTNLSVYDMSLTVTLNESLPRCSTIKLEILDGIKNKYGVTGGSAWDYSSRTICQVVFSIGTSVQDRSILAYKFGSGSSKIIYVGGTHGDEKSSVYTLISWIDYLEANGGLPSKRTIVVIPNLNPDGFAASRRTNANNVDINRNFPANNWKRNVTMPDLSYNPGGGGSKPLSEPESKALANYVLSQNPRVVLTYHAAAGVIIPNGSGDSGGIAKTYAVNSNLNFANTSETDSLFPYDTTGAFEDWLHDKHGTPALLAELWTISANEFDANRPAMWAIANLP